MEKWGEHGTWKLAELQLLRHSEALGGIFLFEVDLFSLPEDSRGGEAAWKYFQGHRFDWFAEKEVP